MSQGYDHLGQVLKTRERTATKVSIRQKKRQQKKPAKVITIIRKMLNDT